MDTPQTLSGPEKLDLLAGCVAFAVAHLRVPLATPDRPAIPAHQVDWRNNFLTALEKCGYGSGGEYPVNRLNGETNNSRLSWPKRNGVLV